MERGASGKWSGLMWYAVVVVIAFVAGFANSSTTDMAVRASVPSDGTAGGYTTPDRYEAGMEAGFKALTALPGYEKYCDSCLKAMVEGTPGKGDAAAPPRTTYAELLEQAYAAESQTDPGRIEELEGFASVLSGRRADVLGDGKLSRDEYMIINLIPDIAGKLSIDAYAGRSAG